MSEPLTCLTLASSGGRVFSVLFLRWVAQRSETRRALSWKQSAERATPASHVRAVVGRAMFGRAPAGL